MKLIMLIYKKKEKYMNFVQYDKHEILKLSIDEIIKIKQQYRIKIKALKDNQNG